MTALALFGAVVLGMAAVHMVRLRVEEHWLTSAQFFAGLETARSGWPRLALSVPLTSPAFYVRMLAAMLLLLAVLAARCAATLPGGLQDGGVWILVDTSASMSAVQEGEPRSAAALRAVRETVQQLQEAAPDAVRCWRINGFHLASAGGVTAREPGALLARLNELLPTALGTDVAVVRSALAEAAADADPACVIRQVAVISDLPAPEWFGDEGPVRAVWRDIAQPVANTGLARLTAVRNPFTGAVAETAVELRAYGPPPPAATLTIIPPNGSPEQRPARWEGDGQWFERIETTTPGAYVFKVEPGGAYRYDDEATIIVPDSSGLRVDWRLADRTWLTRLGWTQDTAAPELRVTANAADTGPAGAALVPMLVVGPGYLGARSDAALISGFREGSPLLNDLNFDIAERMVIPPAVLPDGFLPVLQKSGGGVWLAERADPPAAYVPGLPTGSDDDLGRASSVAFFNALHLLLQRRPAPPLFELTSVDHPAPEGNRLALHPDEGATFQTPRDAGTLDAAGPQEGAIEQALWPALLAAAAACIATERALAAWGGRRWQ